MKPVLFTIGSFNVYAFGFFLFLSFLFATFIIWKRGKEEFKEEEYLDAFLYTSIAALITSRLVYILFHFDQFGFNLLRYIVVRETPGLSLIGAFLGGLIFLKIYSKAKKMDFIRLLDMFSLASCFALILAKIGEQLGGGGFGRETDFFVGVKIAGKTGRYHPVELYEAFVFFLLFLLLLFLYHKTETKKWPSGLTSVVFVFLTSLSVFLLEFLKAYPVYLYGLSLRHLVSMGIAVLLAKPLFTKVVSVVKLVRGKKI